MTQKPEHAVETINQLGFHTVKGGHHEKWGTYNGLCHFGLSYIEFIGIEQREKVESVTDNTLISQIASIPSGQEGLIRIAFRTTDIEQATLHFHSDTEQLVEEKEIKDRLGPSFITITSSPLKETLLLNGGCYYFDY